MRAMIFVLVGTVLLGVSSIASGGIDPEPNKLGIYFDPEGYDQCADLGPIVPVTAYILLTNPTHETLYGWEAAIRPVSEELYVLSGEMAGGGTNSAGLPDFAVSYGVPLVTQDVMVLATVDLLSSVYMNCLILTGVSNPSLPEDLPLVWWEENVPSVIQTTKMTNNGVVAAIGGCLVIPESPMPCIDVVSTRGMTWGGLKAKYR